MKHVVVVTVNYNTADDTNKFLASVQKVKKNHFALSVIVVDNGSTKPMILEQKTQTKLIRLEQNSGFTGGYNVGIKKALAEDADYVLVVNNDTTIDEKLIQNMFEVLEGNEKIGATVPKIYFAKGHEFHKENYTKEALGKVLWYAGGYIDWNNAISVHRGVDEVDHGQYDTIERTDFATGCCIMFKKEVFQKIGFFDDKYFLYYEDADISLRMQRNGYTIMYVPTAVLYHINASSSGGAGKGNLLQDYFITRNQMLFGLKYAPFRTKIALFRQSLRLLISGRLKQRQAIRDFYLKRFGKGTFFDTNND